MRESPVKSWRFRGDRALGGSNPPAARTLGALIAEMAERHTDREALVHGGVRVTYSALDKHVTDIARGLIALGLSKGDQIAIFMGNRAEWVLLWLAINRIGGIAVGVSTWSSSSELSYILRHSDARLLIYSSSTGSRDLAEIVTESLRQAGWSAHTPLAPELPCLRKTICLPSDVGGLQALQEIVRGGQDVSAALIEALDHEVRPADVALLLYTSGSTATPKGVQLVHRILIENGYDIGEGEKIAPGDRFWLSLPLFWSAGSANSVMSTLTHGATVILQEFFEATEAVRLLREERCTHYFAFPNVTQAIFDALGDAPLLPAAKTAVTTGQPEILSMLGKMGFARLLHPYGTTEDYGFATINGSDETFETLAWSQGRPLPGMELSIRDMGTSAEVARGEAGEICLRGNVTIGYYKDEEKSRLVLDDEGYFHTGDVAIQHPDGRLQFLGRSTEMIKTSGFNVSPTEVEAVLLGLPSVAEAYVVGIPDQDRGQTVIACVRCSKNTAPILSSDALKQHWRVGALILQGTERLFVHE